MTVIRPNSISGITSITAQANEINIFRSDGTLAGLQINGINFNNTSGISTLAALNVTGNVSIAGTLTYEDVTNVDSVGIITARSGINCGGDLDITGQYLKIENAGSPEIQLTDTNANNSLCFIRNSSGNLRLSADNNNVQTDTSIRFLVDGGEKARIDSSGRLGIGDDSPTVAVSIKNTAPKIKFIDSDATGTPETLVDGSGGDLILDVDKDDEKSSSLFMVKIDGSEKLRITSNGDVGIGYNSPTNKLHVRKNDSGASSYDSRYHMICENNG